MAKGNETQVSANNVSLIGHGTEIEGEIRCGGDLRVDGAVSGRLEVKGKLVVGTGGSIEGEVTCRNGDISGNLNGKIQVQELLTLKHTAKLTGDIITKKLCIEPGCEFSGSCLMGDKPSSSRKADEVVRDMTHA